VVVFVHGIFGDSDSTWRYSPRVYWPRLLLTDEAFQDSDIYVASYSSPYFGNTMNVDEVVTEQEVQRSTLRNKKSCPQSQTRNIGKHQTRNCIFLLSEIPIKLIGRS
jgi:hypothetical protein